MTKELTSLAAFDEWKEKLKNIRASFDIREEYTKNVGWFIITKEVVTILSEFLKDKNTIEVLAGTGYFAKCIRDKGNISRKQYKAYDNGSFMKYKNEFKTVTKKNTFNTPIKKADVIIMNWPEYSENHAERIVKKMVSGQYLIYNGETYGGCTGNDEFFNILERDFSILEDITSELNDHHVRFFGINDYWHVYQKK